MLGETIQLMDKMIHLRLEGNHSIVMNDEVAQALHLLLWHLPMNPLQGFRLADAIARHDSLDTHVLGSTHAHHE